jgi:hypothetical protein
VATLLMLNRGSDSAPSPPKRLCGLCARDVRDLLEAADVMAFRADPKEAIKAVDQRHFLVDQSGVEPPTSPVRGVRSTS